MTQTPPVPAPAGRWLARPGGHRTFEPAPLPPAGLRLDGATFRLLAAADRELGYLHGQVAARSTAAALGDLACLREAVASCRLEGSTVTLPDLLWWELDGPRAELGCTRGDVRICANYADLLRRLDALAEAEPVSPLRRQALCALHAELFRGVRGRDAQPGRLRTEEIWLGPRGSTLRTAHYVPPAPEHIDEHLTRLLAFAVDDPPLPPLVRTALMVCQLESIHPFVDGSGRVARLTLARLLHGSHGAGARLLCPSVRLAEDVGSHFARLQRVRQEGDWEGWIRHVAGQLRDAARAAADDVAAGDALLREHEELIRRDEPTLRDTAIPLLHHLASRPLLSVASAARVCGRTYANANQLVRRLAARGVLREITGRQRHRRYVWEPYVALLQRV